MISNNTRGIDADRIESHSRAPAISTMIKLSTAQTVLSNESKTDTYYSRPVTGFQKMLEKISALGLSSQATSSSGGSQGGDLFKAKAVSAQTISKNVVKLVSFEDKVIRQEKLVCSNFKQWATTFTSPGCQAMIQEFGSMYSSEINFKVALNEKMDRIRIALNEVYNRENMHATSIQEKIKLMKELKDSEMKHGKKSSNTTAIRERLEVVVSNINVLSSQCTRAIARELKESLMDYLISLQFGVRSLSESSMEFLNTVTDIDWEADVSPHQKRLTFSSSSDNSPQANQIKSQNDDNLIVAGTYIGRVTTDQAVNTKIPLSKSARMFTQQNNSNAKVANEEYKSCQLCVRDHYGRTNSPCIHQTGRLPKNQNTAVHVQGSENVGPYNEEVSRSPSKARPEGNGVTFSSIIPMSYQNNEHWGFA